MPRCSRPTRDDPRWLGLGEASRVLGVSTATVRRWADSGRLKPFTTPGGHRRFSRASLERLLPADRDRRPDLATGGLTQTRLTRAYRRDVTARIEQPAWLATLDSVDRSAFRDLGRRLAWALVAHLDAEEPDTRAARLAEATALAADYGRRGAELGLPMSDVVEGFLAFRRPFLGEMGAVARRRGFDGDEVRTLHDDADRALDHLLVATMSGHSLRVGARPPRSMRRPTQARLDPAVD